MISYPTSKLHHKISSEKSSGCIDSKSLCSSVCSSINSSTSNIIHDSSCESKYNIGEWNCCQNEKKCGIAEYCANELNLCQNDDSCEKILNFCENHTSGILKITQIRGDLGTGILRISFGNCIDLNSHLFNGLLNVSIIIDGHDNVNIKFNKCKKIQMTKHHYAVFKRKNNCEWEIISFHELKNMSKNYYFKTKNICSLKENECKNPLFNENIIFENKKCEKEKTKCDKNTKTCSISSDSSSNSSNCKKL